jgi:hypothetical protein
MHVPIYTTFASRLRPHGAQQLFFFCCQDQLQKLRLGLGTHGQVLVVLIVYKRDQIYVAYSHHPICDFLVSTTSIIFIVARAFHLTNSHTNTKALWWRFV